MIINTNLPAQIPARKASETLPGKLVSRLGPGNQLIGPNDDAASPNTDNLSGAQSLIQDVNLADESTRYAAQNILNGSSTAMLAQANLLSQSVLKLLQ